MKCRECGEPVLGYIVGIYRCLSCGYMGDKEESSEVSWEDYARDYMDSLDDEELMDSSRVFTDITQKYTREGKIPPPDTDLKVLIMTCQTFRVRR